MLTNNFPIQIFRSRTLIYDEWEFHSLMNRMNGIKDCYYSLYQFNHETYFEKAEIDKVWFDFDDEGCIEDVTKLHNYLRMQALKHLILWSGRGFHIYIFTSNGANLENNKATLMATHRHFINLLNIKVDEKVIGDVARIARYPNTWNLKRKLYCIPITTEDLRKGTDWIKQKAKNQCFDFVYYGTKLLDLSKFATTENKVFYKSEFNENITMTIINDKFLNTLPPCVAAALQEGILKFRQRYIVLTYLKDKGFNYSSAMSIIKAYCKPDRFEHIVKHEPHTRYIFKNDSYFPNCETIKQDGLCLKGCKINVKLKTK